MAYSQQNFVKGQILEHTDLNIMSEGIVSKQDALVSANNIKTINGVSLLGSGNIDLNQVLDNSYYSTLTYKDNTQITDISGDLDKSTVPNARVVMSDYLAVNEGDSISIDNPNIVFIFYAYQSRGLDGFCGYIDTNPVDNSSNLENWGNSFTFTKKLYISDNEVEVNYPLYVRMTFKHSDGKNTVISKNDIQNYMTYNITADNTHLYKISTFIKDVSKTATPFLTTNLISHRGLCGVAPENTMSAVQKAYNAGLKIIEVDVQMTSDNIPVLLHDTTINRTSNGSGAISNLTYANASQYDYGSWYNAEYTNEKLPTLEEFLVWSKTRGICVELDLANRGFTTTQKEIIYNMVLNLGMIESTMFTATTLELADYLNFNPNIIISIAGITSLSIAQNVLPEYVKYGLVFPSIPVANLSKDIVRYVHSLGMKAKTWTVNDVATRDAALSYGVDVILSDELTSLY